MIRYFDASALAKRYVKEPESQFVTRLLAESSPATSRLSEVEVASALFRRAREGAILARDRDRALTSLRNDFAVLYVVELSAEITAAAIGLLARYRLRASDATQLATCLQFQELVGASIEFVVYDSRLAGVARQEGMTVVGA